MVMKREELGLNEAPLAASVHKLAKSEEKIKEMGLEWISTAWLMDHYKVATIDELFVREGVYDYLDHMQNMIEQLEKK